MGSVCLELDVVVRIRTFGPSRTQEEPGAGRDAQMLRLPLLHAIDGEEKIRIVGDIGRHVNHTGGARKNPGVDFVDAVFPKGLSPDPMDWRVKMCARGFPRLKSLPVPPPTPILATRNFPQTQLPP